MSVQVNTTPQVVHLRAEEAQKKAGLTFADLCELVDKGREQGVLAEAKVHAKTSSKYDRDERGKIRDGYYVRYLDV